MDKPLTLTGAETRILDKLMDATEPVPKIELMKGVTESDASFKVMIAKLRGKGFALHPGKRGLAAPAAYSLSAEEKVRLRKMGL